MAIDKKVTLSQVQTEVDTAWLYSRLAEHEEDALVAEVFLNMSAIENEHARAFMVSNGRQSSELPGPSWRAKTLDRIGRIFGYDYVLGALLDTEKGLSKVVINQKKRQHVELSGNEDSHVKILRNIIGKEAGISGAQMARFEKRHRSVGGNAIRAAVLGGNDGLVSNFSLVMGIAGASGGQEGVLLAGIAGLLAGALSMALGEWISVKSSQELYEHQMNLEMEELTTNPEGERKELVLIYMAKGLDKAQSEKIVENLMSDKGKAHEILVREELGINTEELNGSAMEAALSSFFLFAIGAIIPVLPFFFATGVTAIVLSTIFSALGLFLIGSAITLFTGRSVWYSGTRQVIFGLLAAAITFGIGKLIGVSLAG